MPETIMLIRHAEKPDMPPPNGINADGQEDQHSLIVRGWQRAGALVPFFKTPWVNGIIEPAALYAPGVRDAPLIIDGEDVAKSLRSQQTLTPLANALSLEIQVQCFVGEEDQLFAAIEAENGPVLVAWEHRHIPDIAKKLTSSAPDQWPGNGVFDIVWILQKTNGGYQFSSVNQGLLAGD